MLALHIFNNSICEFASLFFFCSILNIFFHILFPSPLWRSHSFVIKLQDIRGRSVYKARGDEEKKMCMKIIIKVKKSGKSNVLISVQLISHFDMLVFSPTHTALAAVERGTKKLLSFDVIKFIEKHFMLCKLYCCLDSVSLSIFSSLFTPQLLNYYHQFFSAERFFFCCCCICVCMSADDCISLSFSSVLKHSFFREWIFNIVISWIRNTEFQAWEFPDKNQLYTTTEPSDWSGNSIKLIIEVISLIRKYLWCVFQWYLNTLIYRTQFSMFTLDLSRRRTSTLILSSMLRY